MGSGVSVWGASWKTGAWKVGAWRELGTHEQAPPLLPFMPARRRQPDAADRRRDDEALLFVLLI